MADEYYPLTQTIVRNLLDKLYDKRKLAAIDIEKLIKQYQSQNKDDEIRSIIKHCGESFCESSNCHYRKGGTIGLAAVAIALGKQADKYSSAIICPTIKLLQDSDSRVRYYACESLYNCIKVLEANVMPHFQSIFDALSKGYEDPDKDVRSAILQLDRSLRETVIDSTNIDVVNIIVFLRDKIYPKSTQTRLFLINWITSLDATSGVNMALYLPELLDGLLLMLDDTDVTLVTKLRRLLDQFLNKLIQADVDHGYRKLVNILVFHINNANCSEVIRCTALIWLEKFIENFREKILPFTSGILKAILPSFTENTTDENIRIQAKAVSSLLLELIRNTDNINEIIVDSQKSEENSPIRWPGRGRLCKLNLDSNANPCPVPSPLNHGAEDNKLLATQSPESVLTAVGDHLHPVHPCGQLGLADTLATLCQFAGQMYGQQTKLAALDWLHTLIDVAPAHTMRMCEMVFPTLFNFAVDPSSEVIGSGLQLVAKFARKDVMSYIADDRRAFLTVPDDIRTALPPDTNPYFLRFVLDLLVFLDTNLRMLEDKGDLIVGDLCYLLGAELVYNAIAEIVQKSHDLNNKFRLVHKLNRILLSSPTLFEFRAKIKSINSEEFCIIFSRLYRAWSYNRVSLLTLCLLSQNYEHCRHLVKTFGEQEIDVDTLIEIDLLIQFLESPVFVSLRMHLMDPRYSSQLSETLYCLLMLLPQSDAFRILQNRLNCVPRLEHAAFSGFVPYTQVTGPNLKLVAGHIKFNELLANLAAVQRQIRLEQLASRHKITSVHAPHLAISGKITTGVGHERQLSL